MIALATKLGAGSLTLEKDANVTAGPGSKDWINMAMTKIEQVAAAKKKLIDGLKDRRRHWIEVEGPIGREVRRRTIEAYDIEIRRMES